jgi:hypothetical protein
MRHSSANGNAASAWQRFYLHPEVTMTTSDLGGERSESPGGIVDPETLAAKRDRVLDTMISMYQEQSIAARHHETQRSSVSTILVSLSAALLAVIGTLWSKTPAQITPPPSVLPLTLGLIMLAGFGFFIGGKLFERSMLHFHLSEAYLNIIDALIEDDANILLPSKRVRKLEYVRVARKQAKNKIFGSKRRGDIDTVAGKVNLRDRILKQRAENPRFVAVPMHDHVETHTYVRWPWLDLYRLWTRLYFVIALLGTGLTVLAVAGWVTGLKDSEGDATTEQSPASGETLEVPTQEVR